MNYQFIVITACEKRKQKMIEIFKELDISDNLIYYLEASTPQNSEYYFIDSSFIENDMKKVICCTKSHLRAIEYAGKDESPDYTIIVEDDVAFHKIYFVKVIEEIISNWEKDFNNCHYVSLGWIPCNTYEHYKSKNNIKIKSITNIDNNICFLNDFYNRGTQCYIIKKNKTHDIIKTFNQNTYNKFVEKYTSFMKNTYGQNFNSFTTEAADYILNQIMKFSIIFPPLAIEQKNIVSLLHHNNSDIYWHRYFNGHEEEMKNYITY